VHHRDWHVLDKIVENLSRQTFRDFELIIVDLVWSFRKDYIKEKYSNVGFPILHLIDKDSVFKDLQLTRISSAKNTGIMYARGEHLLFSDDGQVWSEDALEHLERWARQGIGGTCRLFRNHGEEDIEIDSRWRAYGINGTLNTKIVPAAAMGYFGGTLSMSPTSNMVQCNGFDEMFDGARQLEDSDMSRRLGNTGLRIAFEGHPMVVEYDMDACCGDVYRHGPGRIDNSRAGVSVKCNGSYCYPLWEKNPGRVRANDVVLTDEVLDTFKTDTCVKLGVGRFCTVAQKGCPMQCNNRALMNIYKDRRLVFDMAELRSYRDWDFVKCDPLLVRI